jgi:hypothetical protein
MRDVLFVMGYWEKGKYEGMTTALWLWNLNRGYDDVRGDVQATAGLA